MTCFSLRMTLNVRFPPAWGCRCTPRKRAADDEPPMEAPEPTPEVDAEVEAEAEADPLSPESEFESISPAHDANSLPHRWDEGSAERCVVEQLTRPESPRVDPGELSMDGIVANLSCRLAMEHKEGAVRGSGQRPDRVPIVSRGYEESYMREAYQGERPCASGNMCECRFIDPVTPFVGVEFVPYGVAPDPHATFCVLCSRKITQRLFYDIVLAGKRPNGVIQRYGNIVNAPGEYARECALVCPTNGPLHCLPAPIVAHQRNKYEVYLSGGTKCIRQLRVGFEDFHRPSTGEKC